MELPPAHVRAVITFYTMFYQRPVGRWHLEVCTNVSCRLRGADQIVECLSKRLGIAPGETTADRKFTLSTVECLASCGTAPMLQLNQDRFHENLTPQSTLQLVEELPAGAIATSERRRQSHNRGCHGAQPVGDSAVVRAQGQRAHPGSDRRQSRFDHGSRRADGAAQSRLHQHAGRRSAEAVHQGRFHSRGRGQIPSRTRPVPRAVPGAGDVRGGADGRLGGNRGAHGPAPGRDPQCRRALHPRDHRDRSIRHGARRMGLQQSMVAAREVFAPPPR